MDGEVSFMVHDGAAVWTGKFGAVVPFGDILPHFPLSFVYTGQIDPSYFIL